MEKQNLQFFLFSADLPRMSFVCWSHEEGRFWRQTFTLWTLYRHQHHSVNNLNFQHFSSSALPPQLWKCYVFWYIFPIISCFNYLYWRLLKKFRSKNCWINTYWMAKNNLFKKCLVFGLHRFVENWYGLFRSRLKEWRVSFS